MKRFLACCMIMRAAQCLPIYRNDSLNGCAEALDPLNKARFKLFGIYERKDPSKGIM